MRSLKNLAVDDHVITVPTVETINTIRDYISTAPFDIETDEKWHVTICVTDRTIDQNDLLPQARYTAKPRTADLWHDTNLGRTNLVVVLESNDLAARHSALQQKYGSKFKTYVPHMTLVYGFPSMSMSTKSFVNSFRESMYRIGLSELFHFTGEALVDSHGYAPNVEGQEFWVNKNF
jgi:hypothetical protein